MERREFLRTSIGLGALAFMHLAGFGCKKETPEPIVKLPALPFDKNALEPYISEQTIRVHYGKHHRAYVNKTNTALSAPCCQYTSLVEIIRDTRGKPEQTALFNNAAQALNHTLYWKSMKPHGGGKPVGEMSDRLREAFGSYDGFYDAFFNAAKSQFGSGWVWLVLDGTTLKVIGTSNADTPVADGLPPLITLDVWEHAYYLDYQNRRADYIKAFLDHLVNWDFAEAMLKGPKAA